MEFKEYKTLIYSFKSNTTILKKIAGFDLDSTIIKTKSGRILAKDMDDWELWNDHVKPVLYNLYNDGYKIVIFTNQKGISKGKVKKEDFIQKVKNIQKELNIAFDIFISTSDDYFRKPMTGMWDFFRQLYSVKLDMKQSFYCGDAAGREKNWIKGKKKDFSSSDKDFAHNIGLKFIIPENLFKADDEPEVKYHSINFSYMGFDLKELMKKRGHHELTPSPNDKTGLETIIMIGRPGSGKTNISKYTLNKPEFKNYQHINQDTCKTRQKCLKLAETSLKEGKSVLIDNTNPDKKSRLDYIKLGKKYGSNITVYVVDIPEHLSKHMNHMRVQKTKGDRKIVPIIAYRIYNKKYEEPVKEEGIDKIVKLDFLYQGKSKEDNEQFQYHYNIS